MHARLAAEFGQSPIVKVARSESGAFLSGLQDHALDYVYIDGDHGYAGALRDLRLARRKVRPGGYIFGHDLRINPAKCRNYRWRARCLLERALPPSFGVRRPWLTSAPRPASGWQPSETTDASPSSS